MGAKLKGLLGLIVNCVEALPDPLHGPPITSHADVMIQRLEVEADDRASVVQHKANQQWIGLEMDAKSRHIMGLHVGDRSRQSARAWWTKMPKADRRPATLDPDPDGVYKGVLPAEQHHAISKLARTTHHIERFNPTRRPRVSRLVRRALSCSKKLANPIGAVQMFICHYNLTRATV